MTFDLLNFLLGAASGAVAVALFTTVLGRRYTVAIPNVSVTLPDHLVTQVVQPPAPKTAADLWAEVYETTLDNAGTTVLPSDYAAARQAANEAVTVAFSRRENNPSKSN